MQVSPENLLSSFLIACGGLSSFGLGRWSVKTPAPVAPVEVECPKPVDPRLQMALVTAAAICLTLAGTWLCGRRKKVSGSGSCADKCKRELAATAVLDSAHDGHSHRGAGHEHAHGSDSGGCEEKTAGHGHASAGHGHGHDEGQDHDAGHSGSCCGGHGDSSESHGHGHDSGHDHSSTKQDDGEAL
mmetsp:Transcript_140398/g.244472  ORF Transcript_140398/g.244472 Transcript_140398/m.244472 type:complete len:186 (-) Transcript_140398:64-621(-)